MLHSLATSEISLADILERTRDINDEVSCLPRAPSLLSPTCCACVAGCVVWCLFRTQQHGYDARAHLAIFIFILIVQVRKMAFAAIRERIPLEYLR